jgi:hypothetical protein
MGLRKILALRPMRLVQVDVARPYYMWCMKLGKPFLALREFLKEKGFERVPQGKYGPVWCMTLCFLRRRHVCSLRESLTLEALSMG